MRVLVTGAAGSLGSSLLPRLTAAGHEVVALDVRAGDAPADWVVADVRDGEAIGSAADGVDVIVHAAALHGIHLRDHAPREFFELNLTGTFNVWQAAVAAGVAGVVFASTMGVYGASRRPAGDADVSVLDEATPLRPADIYGWTKAAGEELCRYHLREHNIPSVALRFGMFVPETFMRYGIRLLYGGVHEDDAARAVLAAANVLETGSIRHAAVNVFGALPFTADDAPDLRRDPLVAVERHFPGSAELLRDRGVRSLKPVSELFPVNRLRNTLGMQPAHSFADWLDELRGRPEVRAASDPPWP